MIRPCSAKPITGAELTDQYETLRESALGRFGRSCRLLQFIHEGMSSWVRGVGRETVRAEVPPSPAICEPMSVHGLAGIIADALLEAARPLVRGGTR